MSLCWYNIQALTLPFSTHRSPFLRLDNLNNYGRNTTERLQYRWIATKDTTNYGYIIPRQLIYFVRPRICIPGSVDSSTALAMDLPPLLAVVE